MSRSGPALCLVVAIGLSWTACAPAPTTKRPNIVLIVVDDMGYSDIGCYGGEIRTPHLDQLAERGVRFSQFYVTPKCMPTRSALLTGLHPPPLRSPEETVTIAEALGQQGYATLFVGKAHGEVIPSMVNARQRGFDRSFGNRGGGNYFRADQHQTYLDDEPYTRGDDFYKTDVETDFALRFIEQSVKPEQPFFLYLAYHAPHWPLHAKPEDVERYRRRYLDGPGPVRSERTRRLAEMGLIDPEWDLSPADGGDWADLDDSQREEASLKMAVHAAMIDCVDQNIGRLIDALRDRGDLDNTLIMFLSDNGACQRDGLWGDFIGADRFGYRYDESAPVGTPDSQFGIGRSWANASNTPFRRFKEDMNEGGIASPLIVFWPDGPGQPDSLRHTPTHVTDILPTCLQAAGVSAPKRYKKRTITTPDGRSLWPIIESDDAPRRDALYWYWDHRRAIRAEGYKALSDTDGIWKLYDLEADRTELNDLSVEQPALLSSLIQRWEDWYRECTGKAYVAPALIDEDG